MKYKRSLYSIFFLCYFLVVTISGQVHAETYPLAVVQQGQWQQESIAFGQVSALAESNIMVPFSLKVTGVQVKPGQLVAAGESLLHFHSPELLKNLTEYANGRKLLVVDEKQQEIVHKGVQEHTLTRMEVIRSEQIVTKGAIALEQFWDKVHTNLMQLNNDIDQKNLDALLDRDEPLIVAGILGVLRAPFDGIIINRPPQVGLWVQADTPLLEFEDLHSVYVRVAVPEDKLSAWLDGETLIEKGNTVFKLQPMNATPGIDLHSGMRLLLFKADNQRVLLRDGEWLRVNHLSTNEPVSWIPESAVVSRNNKTWCIVYKDQKYTPQRIEVGTAIAGKVPVRLGLAAGQQVVRENGYELLYRDLKELIQFVD
jgi:RND family efflux transporter MFP subunit